MHSNVSIECSTEHHVEYATVLVPIQEVLSMTRIYDHGGFLLSRTRQVVFSHVLDDRTGAKMVDRL